MKFNSKVHHRKSIRLKGYNYSLSGSYFVTIGTQNQKCLFGEIISGKMVLNNAGCEAEKCWNHIPDHFSHVELDVYVVMPNHVHGILTIINSVSADTNGTINTVVGAKNFSPKQTRPPCGTSKTIGSIVRGFKIGVTKWMRQNSEIHKVWQRNYYEHIIRNERELNQIRKYIVQNPKKWVLDQGQVGKDKKKFAQAESGKS